MSDGPATSAITRIHREMLDHLSELDRLGEHVAAAHLTAAIDALEERSEAAGMTPTRDRRNDPVEVMAYGLVEKFGDRATRVARRQLEGASGDTLLVWAAIVSRVDEIQMAQSSLVD